MLLPDNFSQYITEDSYKDLFDSALDLIHFVDISGRIIYVNRSWMELTGYSMEEIQGRPIESFITGADRERFGIYRDSIIKGQEIPGHIIIGLETKSGNKVQLEGFISLRKKEGSPEYTRGIFRDITAKLESETLLKEREFNFYQLLVNAPDAVVVINPGSKIIFWNPKATLLFGWTAEEAMGAELPEKIIPSQYREAHRNGMNRYLTTGEAHVLNRTVNITAVKKNGEEFFISLTIANTTQNGAPAFIAFIRDTSEQKKTEAESEQRKRQLEISNEQLEQFAHVASHDMKEPVRKIMLFSERLEKEFSETLPEYAKGYLSKINNSADRLRNIIDGFLNYANVNNIAEAYSNTDLEQILNNIEADLEIIIAEKKATIIYGTFPVFEAVPFLIYQLMYNLVYNALKFSRAGVPAEIIITAEVKAGADFPEWTGALQTDYILVKIKDNGIGFSMEDAEKIFRTFVRLNPRKEFEGTGLGLTLCKNITDRHHGYITAQGQPDKGATFTLLLPLKKIG